MDALQVPIEFRASEDRAGPGRIVGELLNYETRALDRAEVFREGALSWPDAGIILNVQHDRRAIVTRFKPVVEGRAVKIDTPLPDTAAGRDVATLVRNGTLTGLSVEFRATAEGRRNGMREIRSARLIGAAVVDAPSHATRVEVRERSKGRRWWR